MKKKSFNFVSIRVAKQHLVFISCFMVSMLAQADVFRCTDSKGKVVYQEKRCGEGAEKAIDDRDTRMRLLVEADKKATAAKAKKGQEDDEQLLQFCIDGGDCEARTFVTLLRNKSKVFVLGAMGQPSSTQIVSGSELVYYSVRTKGGNTARLQLMYNYHIVESVNAY